MPVRVDNAGSASARMSTGPDRLLEFLRQDTPESLSGANPDSRIFVFKSLH